MNKILIIGAGNIGRMLAYMFSIKGYEVTIADGNAEALLHPYLQSYKKVCIDVTKKVELKPLLKDKTYLVNAGPFFINAKVAAACKETKTHYFDLTEDVEQTEYIRTSLAPNAKVAFVPQCGLAPGFISIVTHNLAKSFDEVHDVKMRVGALPIHPTNRLKYNTSWSVDGLVNEYLHPCNAIKNGKLITIEPLEGYETFNLDGDDYEAFNTSGGLGTMCETWSGKVESMDYKTVRYPGHRYLMQFLIDDLKLGVNNGQAIKDLFNNAIPATVQDVILIFVEVSGIKNGKLVVESYKNKIYGDSHWSGIQKATASGIYNMVELHRCGIIPQTGFVKQEDALFDDFITADRTNGFGVYYGDKT